MMFAKWIGRGVLALGLAAAMAQPVPAAAGTLDNVQASGAMVLGVREASYPLSYLGADGKPIGYHMDICLRIAEAVKARLKLPQLEVKTRTVNSRTRISELVSGAIDLECGSTTNNAARQKEVAFAPTTFVAATRTAVKVSSGITELGQLSGKAVVTTAGSTAVNLLRARQQGQNFDIRTLFGADHAESFQMLESGQAAAFVMDDNLLAGLIASSANPGDYRIIGAPLEVAPIAIMLRRDDPAFKALVDEVVKGLMASGELDKLYAKWFLSPIPPKNITLGFPMGAVLKGLIRFPGDEPAESFIAPE